MNEKNEHPYAHILSAIAEGKTIQLLKNNVKWVDATTREALCCVIDGEKLRVKPATIRIGEYDVPEPMRHKPNYKSRYFVPFTAGEELASEMMWHGDLLDIRWLERGLIHLDKESAILHAKALISLTEKK